MIHAFNNKKNVFSYLYISGNSVKILLFIDSFKSINKLEYVNKF